MRAIEGFPNRSPCDAIGWRTECATREVGQEGKAGQKHASSRGLLLHRSEFNISISF
jgi:hypothetical protein